MLVTAAYKGQDKARHRSVLQYCICTRHFSFDRPVSIAENPPGSSKDACTGVNKFRIRQCKYYHTCSSRVASVRALVNSSSVGSGGKLQQCPYPFA